VLISRRGVIPGDGAVGSGNGRRARRERVVGRCDLERRRGGSRRRAVEVDSARSFRVSGRRRRRLRRRDELMAGSYGRQIPDQPGSSILRAKYVSLTPRLHDTANRLYNRVERTAVRSTGCQTGLTTGLTTGCIV